MDNLTKKQKRKRTKGPKILAETLAKWIDINKDVIAKTRKAPAKDSTKGCMKVEAGLAYDEDARAMYGPSARINLPNYCPNASLLCKTTSSCDLTITCSQSESSEVRESQTAQNVCETSASRVDVMGICNDEGFPEDDMFDIDQLLGVMDQKGESINEAGPSGQPMYDAWFEYKPDDFDFDFFDTGSEDCNFTLEDFGLSLDLAEPVMQIDEQKSELTIGGI
ncbi:hypothetical protein Tco_0771595 [Tanacetum coccineum]|uniref:Uncharacterized protein n=1 Tax=Tanacetum coccineum TaxID=301880 RepID=A0ABQ4ZFJ0_9ASTR